MNGRLPFADDFTPVFGRFEATDTSFSEADALKERFWDLGEPARLREDVRFRPTQWGRWIRADRWLANDRVFAWMAASGVSSSSLDDAIAAIPARLPLVFCTGDPRFEMRGRELSLTALGRKALPRPRKRDLTDEALRGRAERLRERLLTPPVTRTPRRSDPEDADPPTCALVLDGDGLRIVVPPLGSELLPGFVKRLRLLVSPTPLDFPLARLRGGHEEAIPPSVEPYRWIGFMPDGEEVDDPHLVPVLTALTVEGLPPGVVSVFRFGPDERAWYQPGRVVEPGERYRLLFPPDVAVPEGVSTSPAGLYQDSWRVWDLALAPELDAGSVATLTELGLTVGVRSVRLEWCGDPPSAWAWLGGEPAPVFDPADLVALRVVGQASEQVALLVGREGCFRLPMDPTLPVVRCEELAPGPYVLEVIAREMDVPRARVWFEVRADAGAPPRAEVQVLLDVSEGDEIEIFQPLGQELPRARLDQVAVRAPPCWPVVVTWHGLDTPRPVRAVTDRDGRLEAAFAAMSEHLTREVYGGLEVSFGELGRQRFEHHHLPTQETLSGALGSVLGLATHGLPRDVATWRRMWFEPLLRPLGYALGEPVPSEQGVGWPLWAVRDTERGPRAREAAWLVLVPEGTDVGSDAAKTLAAHLVPGSVRRVLLTDGLTWRRLTRRGVPGPVFTLREASAGGLALEVALEALAAEVG